LHPFAEPPCQRRLRRCPVPAARRVLDSLCRTQAHHVLAGPQHARWRAGALTRQSRVAVGSRPTRHILSCADLGFTPIPLANTTHPCADLGCTPIPLSSLVLTLPFFSRETSRLRSGGRPCGTACPPRTSHHTACPSHFPIVPYDTNSWHHVCPTLSCLTVTLPISPHDASRHHTGCRATRLILRITILRDVALAKQGKLNPVFSLPRFR
jgi:hypothetical protein